MKGNAARCNKEICHWTKDGKCAFDPPCPQTNPDSSYISNKLDELAQLSQEIGEYK